MYIFICMYIHTYLYKCTQIQHLKVAMLIALVSLGSYGYGGGVDRTDTWNVKLI